jgi:WXG100 family type VII secretion target
MAREWKVRTEKLTHSAGVVLDKNTKYEQEWKKLYSEIEQLKSAKWTGVASDEFNRSLESYKPNFEEMGKTLKKYAEALQKIAQNYEKTEDSIKGAAGSLHRG